VILGQNLTLNHPSLVDEGEETKSFFYGLEERKKKERILYFLSYQLN